MTPDPASDPTAAASDAERRIVDVVMALGPGEVVSYGDVAAIATGRRHARLVGRVLRDTDAEVPWWRVVRADGRLAAGDGREQATLLRAEGVVVRSGRVVDAPDGRFAGVRRPGS